MEGHVVKNEKTVNEKWKSVNEKWKSIKSDYTRQFVKFENRTRKAARRMKKAISCCKELTLYLSTSLVLGVGSNEKYNWTWWAGGWSIVWIFFRSETFESNLPKQIGI